MNINGWEVTASDCGTYLYLERNGAPGQIHIKAEGEGFVVDIWSSDVGPICVATTCATYSELEPE
jgi:hypothetical protein